VASRVASADVHLSQDGGTYFRLLEGVTNVAATVRVSVGTGPSPPPNIVGIERRDSGAVRFSFTGVRGRRYTI
jgi:hypothetical protein